jgi:hypothetical protein
LKLGRRRRLRRRWLHQGFRWGKRDRHGGILRSCRRGTEQFDSDDQGCGEKCAHDTVAFPFRSNASAVLAPLWRVFASKTPPKFAGLPSEKRCPKGNREVILSPLQLFFFINLDRQ